MSGLKRDIPSPGGTGAASVHDYNEQGSQLYGQLQMSRLSLVARADACEAACTWICRLVMHHEALNLPVAAVLRS